MYTPNPSHRNGNPRKSQWSIPVPNEIECFTIANTNGWILQNEGWGLYYPNGSPLTLGWLTGNTKTTFIAKFVTSRSVTPQAAWHGYPADHQGKAQDIPATKILKNWLDLNLIGAAKIRKISKGQPCSL